MEEIIEIPISEVNRNSDSFAWDNVCMSTGERLKQARKAAGMTQAELAKKVGMAQATISELEGGKSSGTTQIASIALALKVNSLWLETGKGSPTLDKHPPQTDDEAAFLALYRRLEPRDREVVFRMAEVLANGSDSSQRKTG